MLGSPDHGHQVNASSLIDLRDRSCTLNSLLTDGYGLPPSSNWYLHSLLHVPSLSLFLYIGPNRTPFGISVVLNTPNPAPGIDESLIVRIGGVEAIAADSLMLSPTVLSSMICKGPWTGHSAGHSP